MVVKAFCFIGPNEASLPGAIVTLQSFCIGSKSKRLLHYVCLRAVKFAMTECWIENNNMQRHCEERKRRSNLFIIGLLKFVLGAQL